MDDSTNPKFRVAALGKFYNMRIRKKLGANQECVVGRVELCAKFVKLLKGYGYGRRTRCGEPRRLRRSASDGVLSCGS